MRGSVFVGTSLDGFIARTDGRLDFLDPWAGEPAGFEEFLASVDAIVMGRKTYDIVLDGGTWDYGAKPVYVLSTRDIAQPPVGSVVERMSGTPNDIATALAGRGIECIYVDGGTTTQQFLRAGLIQRLIIARVPVLIGSGISLFGELERDVVLRHVATRNLANGLIQSEYEVAG